jgi:hypothetical protein
MRDLEPNATPVLILTIANESKRKAANVALREHEVHQLVDALQEALERLALG